MEKNYNISIAPEYSPELVAPVTIEGENTNLESDGERPPLLPPMDLEDEELNAAYNRARLQGGSEYDNYVRLKKEREEWSHEGSAGLEDGADSVGDVLKNKNVGDKIKAAIKNGEFKGKQIEIPLDDGSKLILRRDVGPGARHHVKGHGVVDHYNFQIQVPKGPGEKGFKKGGFNQHIILDKDGNITAVE